MKSIFNIFFCSIILCSFSQCSSAQKLQDNAPIEYGEVYFQKWVAGIQGGGSGLDLYVTKVHKKQNIEFDSVYFRGKVAKLEYGLESKILEGSFSTIFNKKQDVILSDKPKDEFGNEAPIIPKKIPFDLKDNECVISYKYSSIIKYFKIENIKEKQMLSYPSAPPNKQ
jgi:hypothetical protein